MNDMSEDRFIHRLLVGGAIVFIAGFVVTSLVVAAMISANFNFLSWLE